MPLVNINQFSSKYHCLGGLSVEGQWFEPPSGQVKDWKIDTITSVVNIHHF